MSCFEFEAIGILRTQAVYPQEAPRQGVLSGRGGVIELLPGRNFEAAVSDLDGIDRIWIVFVFDRVHNWKPKVRPPLGGTDRRIGVFATRSPHRPNPIGITAARLDAVKGLSLFVSETDLLDGTPVLDIKPYIPMADSFPDAKTGWRGEFENPQISIIWREHAARKAKFLNSCGGPDLQEFSRIQLGTRDIDPGRLRLTGPDENGVSTLAFRTWRIDFIHHPEQITVTDIRSGYTAEELLPDAADKYHDKELHRLFRKSF